MRLEAFCKWLDKARDEFRKDMEAYQQRKEIPADLDFEDWLTQYEATVEGCIVDHEQAQEKEIGR